MNSLNYFVAICAVIVLPATLLGAFWWYIMKRGWASKWLLATSITVFMSLLFIVLSLAAEENSLLFIGLGVSVLGGIGFYVYLRTSPMGDILIGQNQQMQSEWESLSDEERSARKQSARLTIRDVIVVRLLQYIPTIIIVVILLFSRGAPSKATTTLIAFIFGFTGILRIVLRPKHPAFQLYAPKSGMIGDILLTVLAWGVALYNLLTG
jgi:hypothetical protein